MNILDMITVTDIKQVFTVMSPRGRTAVINNRKYYGISLCSEGKMTYTTDGKPVVSDINHIVILPKGKSYSLHGDKSGKFPVINFDSYNFICDEVLSFPIKNTDAYIKDYEKIKTLSLFDGNRAKIMSIFYSIIHRVVSENSAQSQLTPAIRLIENNFSQPDLSNAIMARECNISEVYFRKLFSEKYKTSPKQYLIEIRINKAKQLLTEENLKIGVIAEQCGFNNQYHFCRLFKEKTGLTPTQYIKNNRIYKI